MEREDKKAVTGFSCLLLLSPAEGVRRVESPFDSVVSPREQRSRSNWFELTVRLGWCEPLVPVRDVASLSGVRPGTNE